MHVSNGSTSSKPLAHMFHSSNNSHNILVVSYLHRTPKYENNLFCEFFIILDRKVPLKIFFTSTEISIKKGTFHYFIFVVSNRVYSLCHCRFNDLFMNPVRGWIYFNKYTAVWQFCIWPHWIFHNLKRSGEEEGGEKRMKALRTKHTEQSDTHEQRTSSSDKGNMQTKRRDMKYVQPWCVHDLLIVL